MRVIKVTSCGDRDHSKHSERKKKKKSKKESGNYRRDLFSSRSVIGPRDILVNVPLGKVALSQDDQEIKGVIKKEASVKMESGFVGCEVNNAENDQVKDDARRRLESGDHRDVENIIMDTHLEFEKVEVPSSITPCSCACWKEIELLKQVVQQQGEQIQGLNSVVVQLLGKQLKSNSENGSMIQKEIRRNQQTQREERSERKDNQCDANSVEGDGSLINGDINHVKDIASKGPSRFLSGSEISSGSSLDASHSMNESSIHPRPPLNAEQPSNAGSMVNASCLKKFASTNESEKEIETDATDQQSNRSTSIDEHSIRISTNRTTDGETFPCDQCSKSFHYKNSLNYHKKIVHQGIRYQCSYCPGYFTRGNRLLAHEKIHTSGKDLVKCDVCGMAFSSPKLLAGHITSRHYKKISQKPERTLNKTQFRCAYQGCAKTYNCEPSFRYHLNKEHGLVSFVAEEYLKSRVKK